MSVDGKCVVIVDPVSSGMPLRTAASELGYRVLAIFTISPSEYISIGIGAATFEPVSSLEQVHHCTEIAQVAQLVASEQLEVAAVLPGSEPGVEFADKLAAHFHCVGNDLSLSEARRDKLLMRQQLVSAGVDTIPFISCRNVFEALTFFEQQKGPVVVKTPKGAGTNLVFTCHSREQVVSAVNTVLTTPNLFGILLSYCVVEKWVGGDEYIVNLFCDGEQYYCTDIWVYEKVSSKHFDNIYKSIRLINEALPQRQALIDHAIECAKALGMTQGPIHAELKWYQDKAVLIEAGARLSGANIPNLVKQVSQLDLYRLTLAHYLGQSIEWPEHDKAQQNVIILYIPHLDDAGHVVSIEGLDELEHLASLHRVVKQVDIGHQVQPSSCHGDSLLTLELIHADMRMIQSDEQRIHDAFRVKLNYATQ